MFKKKFWIGICVFLLVLLVLVFVLYQAAISGPDFYREAMEVDQPASLEAGSKFENRILDTHNAMVRDSNWSIVITDRQLNGWLRSFFRQNYSRFAPDQIENLTVSFSDQRIKIAFRLTDWVIPAVISIDLVPFVTENENQVAVKIEHIRMGHLPLPSKRATDQLSRSFERAKIPLVWMMEQGKPVGMIPVEFRLRQEIGRVCTVRNISLQTGELTISGTAKDSE